MLPRYEKAQAFIPPCAELFCFFFLENPLNLLPTLCSTHLSSLALLFLLLLQYIVRNLSFEIRETCVQILTPPLVSRIMLEK